MLEQKYPKSLTEASLLKAEEITLKVLRQPKTTKTEEIIPFTATNDISHLRQTTHGVV